MDFVKIHKEETAKLINATDNSGCIHLNGSLSEKKTTIIKGTKDGR